MANLTVVEKTIHQIQEERVSKNFRLTTGRLNQVFEFLKIPYTASSRLVGKGKRAYDLENNKGQHVSFDSMKELVFETPIKAAIEKRVVSQVSKNGFFADISNSISKIKPMKAKKLGKTHAKAA
ncbi:MAG: hypothetical protein WC055_01050 [Melioribacteraceae bacterium]